MSDLELTPEGGLEAAAAAGGGAGADEEPAPLETTVEVACAVCGATEPMLIRYRQKNGQLVDAANRSVTLAVSGHDIVVRLRKTNATAGANEADEFHIPVTAFLRP